MTRSYEFNVRLYADGDVKVEAIDAPELTRGQVRQRLFDWWFDAHRMHIAPEYPERMASCPLCRTMVRSREDLPFFRPRPDFTTDEYYCGCRDGR